MEITKLISSLSDKSLYNIHTTLYKYGILSIFENNGSRIVFYLSKNKRFEELDKLKLECNGLVFDINNMRPIVIPQCSPRSSFNQSVINFHIENNTYDILYMEDGTVINLYWWQPMNEWRISTNKSYDITDQKWVSNTYREVLHIILGENVIKFYELLDKTRTYTFGIKYDDAHPFRDNDIIKNKIWFIQSVNLYTLEKTFDFKNDINIHNQKFVENDFNIKNIHTNLYHALDNYIKTRKNPLFGYILRSKNYDITQTYSNVFLESTLLQKIRHMCYHMSLVNISKNMNYNKNLFIIINAYLNINTRDVFITLFPHFTQTFIKLDSIIDNLSEQIVKYSKNQNNDEYNQLSERNKSYISVLYNMINRNYIIKGENKVLIPLIKSYLLMSKWVDMYYNLLIN